VTHGYDRQTDGQTDIRIANAALNYVVRQMNGDMLCCQVYQSALQLLSNMLYYDTEPTEPPLDVFLDVIAHMLQSQYTVEKTRDVVVLVLTRATVNRSAFVSFYYDCKWNKSNIA